jgi:methanogenic corrinoid protein MtbC1
MKGHTDEAAEMLSLEDAASRLGVHYMTAYRYVRLGKLAAQQQAGRWWVRAEDLEELAGPAAPGRGKKASGFGRTRLQLVNRMLEGDVSGCWAIVEQVLSRGASPTDVYLEVLGPALREIGDRWEIGRASVGEEHRASAVAMRLVGRLGPRFARRGTPVAGTVLLGGAPGDPHVLPGAMLADILRNRGFKVVDLGANVPEITFVEAAETIEDLRAVGISVSDKDRVPAVTSVISALRRQNPSSQVLAGGPALGDRDEASALGADGWASDGATAADLLEAVS